ncbi:hypothetical protein C427_2996 [Paraglaciecola psychrophila 170]|uniref:Uncharacterized protein n=1 Tax=Paraglaciecola psychrophila 170 TaxID=1129794 RepID=K6ZS55_9ALTE|nr:hypothetical protein C427_2996 [Paraglaciecola psychrophila 170]GAC38751.1 hypothetical protein GPSY_3140 [Paraglaciecola psychrophila 170]
MTHYTYMPEVPMMVKILFTIYCVFQLTFFYSGKPYLGVASSLKYVQ